MRWTMRIASRQTEGTNFGQALVEAAVKTGQHAAVLALDEYEQLAEIAEIRLSLSRSRRSPAPAR